MTTLHLEWQYPYSGRKATAATRSGVREISAFAGPSTSFAPPPPSGAGLLPNCAQPEPVLSTLAEFGASDAGAAAAPAGFERPQTSLNGCQLHSGNGLFSETAPLIELGATTPSLERAAEAPWNTLSAQHLLQNAAQMVQSLSGAVEALLTAHKPVRPAIKLTAPSYRGYGDLTSARDFLDSLAHYQQAMGLDDEEILTRIVPGTLTETAARWYRLSGYRAANLGEFRAAFLREFLPADYERRMRRELELRKQAPEESLQEFVRAMDELFSIAEPHASNEERVERVIREGSRMLFSEDCPETCDEASKTTLSLVVTASRRTTP
ncbi:uncharacterized protein LOC144155554 [Haemaphysalis longicornis]